MSKIPQVRIYYAFLLEEMGYKLVDDPKRYDYEGYEKWVKNYRQAWFKYQDKILNGLQDALEVSFYKPVIDVACAPYFVPTSDPLIMSFKNFPDEFVDELAHELCHVLLTDNDKIQINDGKTDIKLADVWAEMFGDYDFDTLVHIPVQAMMKHLYLDVLKQPKRLDRDIKNSHEYGAAYIESWKYVQDCDYKEIIAKLKKFYAEMLQ